MLSLEIAIYVLESSGHNVTVIDGEIYIDGQKKTALETVEIAIGISPNLGVTAP